MTIGQVAKEVGLSTDTLRYYEKIGLVPPVKRNNSKIRDYQEKDIIWLNFVKCMRNCGLSIDDIIKYVNLVINDSEEVERLDILKNKRLELQARNDELQASIKYLDLKIQNYENGLSLVEKNIK